MDALDALAAATETETNEEDEGNTARGTTTVNGTSTATTTKKTVQAEEGGGGRGRQQQRDASSDDGFDDGEAGSGEDGDRSVEDDGTPMSMTENGTKATGPSTSGGGEDGEEEEEEGDAAADGETPQTKYKPPNQSRENRRVRMFRSASEITQEELASCFHLPSEAACRKLGVGLTVLKRQCRKYGIKRWPFRKMKSLDRLITNVQAGISPGDQNKLLVKSVEELEDQKRRMEECAMLDLDDTTKRLQQAYSKANHKARRNRSEAARIRAQAAANAVRELEAKQKGVPSDVGRRKTVSEEQALLTLAHQLVAKDGKPVEESHAAAAAAMAAHATNKEGLENADDDKMNKPLISLLSNTPTKKAVQSPAATAAPAPASVEVKREEGAAATKTGAPTSNPMPKKGGAAFTDAQVAAEKVLTAVKGAWSPARPARKQDGVDNAEAFLSPMLKRRPAGGENGGEEAETKQRAPKRAATPAKQPTKQPAKRGRKRKEPSVDDDPLASLAAAALDSMGGGGRSSGGGGSSRGRKASGSPTKTSTATTTTTTTAMNDATAAANDATAANADASNKSNAAGARLSAPAVTEDHPAFALPAVKGARSGSSSTRLHHLDLVEVTKLIAEQLQTARGEIFKHFPNLPERELDRAFNVARVSRAVSSGIEALAKRGAAASKKK
jgi:hypothetical protein